MVRVVKRFKTSDCDSDMRGFESHHAPQHKINKTRRRVEKKYLTRLITWGPAVRIRPLQPNFRNTNMFATNLIIELPVDTSITTIPEGIDCTMIIDNDNYQQMYAFLKASVESNIILNVVEESAIDPVNQIFILEEKFVSNTLEAAQQFQNSTEFQEFFVQAFRTRGATVSITTESDVTLNNGFDPTDGYSITNSYELVDVDNPYIMWDTEFPYSG